jgi:hypothetical protein
MDYLILTKTMPSQTTSSSTVLVGNYIVIDIGYLERGDMAVYPRVPDPSYTHKDSENIEDILSIVYRNGIASSLASGDYWIFQP